MQVRVRKSNLKDGQSTEVTYSDFTDPVDVVVQRDGAVVDEFTATGGAFTLTPNTGPGLYGVTVRNTDEAGNIRQATDNLTVR